MGTSKNKSRLFKIAWKLKKDAFKNWSCGKGQKMTISEALVIAWKMIKEFVITGAKRIEVEYTRLVQGVHNAKLVTTMFGIIMTGF